MTLEIKKRTPFMRVRKRKSKERENRERKEKRETEGSHFTLVNE